jgi:hypothetical protein
MAKSNLPHAALKIGYMHLMDSGLFRQIDLSPPSLLTEIRIRRPSWTQTSEGIPLALT